MVDRIASFFALAAVALLTFADGTPAPESSFGSTAVVQLEADVPQVAVTEAGSPLVVGPPPDSLIVLASGGELFTQPVSEPPPGLLPEKFTQPKPVPVKKAAPVAAGHWVTRYAGIRGRRSYTEWVPAAGATSANCANGQCAPAAGYFRGGCSSCR
jgi:hypothetical protein